MIFYFSHSCELTKLCMYRAVWQLQWKDRI